MHSGRRRRSPANLAGRSASRLFGWEEGFGRLGIACSKRVAAWGPPSPSSRMDTSAPGPVDPRIVVCRRRVSRLEPIRLGAPVRPRMRPPRGRRVRTSAVPVRFEGRDATASSGRGNLSNQSDPRLETALNGGLPRRILTGLSHPETLALPILDPAVDPSLAYRRGTVFVPPGTSSPGVKIGWTPRS